MSTDQDILFSVDGAAGIVCLNRPKALNALTLEMCEALSARLAQWASDPAVGFVLIEGAGDRAFCAGGDIRKLYDERQSGGDYPFRFYHDEYRLNAAVHRFPKPYLSILDGIVMGGGVGVSINGARRIVTENVTFAMPETGIGLFPDVGGSYFLPRCPGEIGMFIGLTGARLKAADMVYAGLADRYVPRDALPGLKRALAAETDPDIDRIDAILAAHAGDPGVPPLADYRGAIDGCFAAGSVEEVLARLEQQGGEWAKKQRAVIATKSPTSLKVAFRQIRQGRDSDFEACMQMEWRMVNRFIVGHDFYEGTRAVVIDKDRQPAWDPATLDGVSDQAVAAYFAPLSGGDLTFD